MSDRGQLDATVHAHAAVADAVRLSWSGNAGPVRLTGAALPWMVLPMVLSMTSKLIATPVKGAR
jgi:hypothetical protein